MSDFQLQNPIVAKLGDFTHAEGVQIAAKWLKNKCGVVLPEFVCQEREIPDAIGFNGRESHMIEVKVSRSDFMADRKKHFRRMEDYGMGNYRYFLAPKGILNVLELPDGWGLLQVYNGKARCMLQPEFKKTNHKAERNLLYSYARRAVVKGLHEKVMMTMAQDAVAREQVKEMEQL